MKLVTGYMNDDILRHKLNALTQKTFGFDFEGWVTGGYFQGDYIPYSFEDGSEIISNASANIMKFCQNGEMKAYIQIGTVMTDNKHRRQGLAGRLINTIIAEYREKCDGIYLFGDLSALGFYKKLGFKTANQYAYTIKNSVIANLKRSNGFKRIKPADNALREKYMSYVKSSIISSAFEQTNKFGLQMFYTSGLDNVYYSQNLDCFIVADIETDSTALQSVLYKSYIPLERIIAEIPTGCGEIRLGFTPLAQDAEICDSRLFDGGGDYRLFYLGNSLESIEKERLFFPTLSHA